MKEKKKFVFSGVKISAPHIMLYRKRKFLSKLHRVLELEESVSRSISLEPSIIASLKMLGILTDSCMNSLIKTAIINQYGYEINELLKQLKSEDSG